MRTFRASFTAIAIAFLAVACGGGGDGGGDVTPPPPTDVLISAANQDTVARASVASIMPFVNVPVAPGAAQASTAGPLGGLAQLALGSIKSGIGQSAPTPDGMARSLTVFQETLPCAISGTFTAVLNDRDNNGTISAGDSMSVSFNQCVDDIGLTINGGLSMVISGYELSPVQENMMGSMTFQALTLVDPTGSLSMNGGLAFRLEARQTTEATFLFSSYVVGSDVGLTVSKQGGSGGLSDTFTYREYVVEVSSSTSSVSGAGSETITANGRFHSQALGGELSLRTITPFAFSFTDAAAASPSTGQLTATGRNNTALGLTATGTVQARMDMCDDGDGAWEATKMVTWDSLLR